MFFRIGPTAVLIEPVRLMAQEAARPSPGDADSDSTTGSASADLTAVGSASAATAEPNRTRAVQEVPTSWGCLGRRGALPHESLVRPFLVTWAGAASGPPQGRRPPAHDRVLTY